ncbi:hypothetical protein BA065_03225 [Nanoarchaeota archaeon NZ13-N]|nr:MAG: hypothetical protein BA065_03225 [Nanoarchaeota archaeon NZ13-N]
MRAKKYSNVHCYYCGRLVRIDKAVVLRVSPRIRLDVSDDQKPFLVQVQPIKIYICPACARYRGITKKDLRNKEKEILTKLGIEI